MFHRAAVATCAGLVLLIVTATPVSAAATPLNKNLVKNPGAEAGNASSNPPTGVVAIPKWTKSPAGANAKFTVVSYGAPQYPTLAESQRIGGGDQFFASGLQVSSNSCSNLFQFITLTGRNTLIDSGQIVAKLDVRVATFDNQSDQGRASLAFINGSGNFIGAVNSDFTNQTHGIFQQSVKTQAMPPGTRKMRVILQASGPHDGAECDVYFDKIKVTISKV